MAVWHQPVASKPSLFLRTQLGDGRAACLVPLVGLELHSHGPTGLKSMAQHEKLCSRIDSGAAMLAREPRVADLDRPVPGRYVEVCAASEDLPAFRVASGERDVARVRTARQMDPHRFRRPRFRSRSEPAERLFVRARHEAGKVTVFDRLQSQSIALQHGDLQPVFHSRKATCCAMEIAGYNVGSAPC